MAKISWAIYMNGVACGIALTLGIEGIVLFLLPLVVGK